MQDKFDPKQASSRVYIKQIYEGVRYNVIKWFLY